MRAAGPHSPLSRPSVGIFCRKAFPGHDASRLRSLPGLSRRLPPGKLHATVRAPMRDRQPSALLRRRDLSSKPTPPPSARPPRGEPRFSPRCPLRSAILRHRKARPAAVNPPCLRSMQAPALRRHRQSEHLTRTLKETCAYADHMRTSSGRWMYQVRCRRGDSGIISCRSYRAFL